MTARVAVLGAGSWGTTMAKVLAEHGSDVALLARRPEQAAEINRQRTNRRYLGAVRLPRSVYATCDPREAIASAGAVFCSVPAQTARTLLGELRGAFSAPSGIARDAVLVSLMKGVEDGTGLRMTEMMREATGLPAHRIAAASGPNLAVEIARGEPTAIVIASEDARTAQRVAALCHTPRLHAFPSTDVVGTELGGVLKNLVALAVGIVAGVGYGENTRAAVMTRGLAEMTAFAVAAGAHPDTMIGLAGLGDLIATCSSTRSRNFQAGHLLGEGYAYADVVGQMDQTAEGLRSVEPVLDTAARLGVDMPIARQIHAVLHGKLDPADLAPTLATDEAPELAGVLGAGLATAGHAAAPAAETTKTTTETTQETTA